VNKNVLLYVDGGPGVGLGHVSRGLGLAHALRNQSCDVHTVLPFDSGLEGDFRRAGYESKLCEPVFSHLKKLCEVHACLVLVIDSYRMDWEGLNSDGACGAAPSVVYFDDRYEENSGFAVVVSGSKPEKQFASTRYLSGPSYQIVRPEFVDVPIRAPSKEVRRLLVLLGGGDPLGVSGELMNYFVHQFLPSRPETRVDFPIGPFFDPSIPEMPHDRLHYHRSPCDLRRLMIEADLAVSAGGQTLHELARCGTPCIAFCAGSNQMSNLKLMASAGVIHWIGWAKGPGWIHQLNESLEALMKNEPERGRLSERGRVLIDGKGGERVARVISRLVVAHPSRVD